MSSDQSFNDYFASVSNNSHYNQSASPKIIFSKDGFYLICGNDSNADEILVKIDNTKELTGSEKYDRYVNLRDGDKFNLGVVYDVEVSFVSPEQNVGNDEGNNAICYCAEFETNSEKGYSDCVNQKHFLCDVCSKTNVCVRCIEEYCYCSMRGKCNQQFFACPSNTHIICGICYQFGVCQFEGNN